jgi:hypothetical protein
VAPVASQINIKLLGELSQGFYDTQIFDLFQYGFPLNLDKESFIPNLAVTNHGSALQFPAKVNTYFCDETHFGAMLSQFLDPPFPDLHCSPLMTAPKDGNKRCIIVDMSFPSPSSHSVNLSVNNIIRNTTKVFKVDLARAFRQLHLDPFDVKYMGLRLGELLCRHLCSVRVLSMTQASVCVTDLICYIISRMGIFVLNSINDIIGFVPDSVADTHFQLTVGTLLQLGFYLNHG